MRANEQIIHKAAWLYYTHNMRQEEVAQALNISRASVAAHLRRAREMGIVSIVTSTRLFSEETLARKLEDALKLDRVWVIPEGTAAISAETNAASVSANAFIEMVKPGDRIGVAWGRTVYHIADAMDVADMQDVSVMQLCGNIGAAYDYRPDQCTFEIARKLNAQPINLYAPLVLGSADLAQALLREETLAQQMTALKDCDLALYSVGSVEPDSHIVACGALTATELESLRNAGAAGVIGGQLIDQTGQWLDCDYNRRLISADLALIRQIRRRFMVVIEPGKFSALKAALRGGFVSHLVVLEATAERLLGEEFA